TTPITNSSDQARSNMNRRAEAPEMMRKGAVSAPRPGRPDYGRPRRGSQRRAVAHLAAATPIRWAAAPARQWPGAATGLRLADRGRGDAGGRAGSLVVLVLVVVVEILVRLLVGLLDLALG